MGAGEVPGQAGNNHPTFIPTGVFQTADGLINIQARGQKLWKRLTVAIGAPGLAENPDYAERESRLENRDALNERINSLTSQKTTAEWVTLLNEVAFPAAPYIRWIRRWPTRRSRRWGWRRAYNILS